MVDHKRCGKCKTEKPLEQFYKRSIARDGRQSYCAECMNADLASRRQSNYVSRSEANRYERLLRRVLLCLASQEEFDELAAWADAD
jgi:hypothetical protein